MKDIILAREVDANGNPTGNIWAGNGLFRRHIEDAAELDGLRHWIRERGGVDTVHDFADLRVLGIDIGTLRGDVTVDAVAVVTMLAERLHSLVFKATTP